MIIMNEVLNIPEVLSKLDYKIEFDSNGKEKSRKLLQTVRNVETVLEEDSRFTGKIKFDEFSQQAYLMGEVPWSQQPNYRAWSSYDDSALFAILQSDYGLNRRPDFFDALKNVSMRHSFHPVRELLNSLKWDGKDRMRGLLPDYLGAEDSQYTYEVMRLFLLGGVARIFQPGIKFDYTLILQGAQGIGKSTFLQLLALKSEWFNDSLDSLDSDKAAQSLLGSWIIELAELKALARTGGGTDSIKRFLTAQQDKYRIPYERRADVFPRQCIFSGTTNKTDFLADETGNRRFLIVPTGITKPRKNLFVPEAKEDMLQAWAEAVHIWKTEQPELLLPESCREEAKALQEESVSDDGKIGIITEYLENKKRTCALEIWQNALNESGRPQKWQAGEINNIIAAIPGWKKMKNPGRFGEFGFQRGFEYVNKPENVNTDFVVVNSTEAAQVPFH